MKLGLGLQWTIKDRCKWFKFMWLRVKQRTRLVFSEKDLLWEDDLCADRGQPNFCCQLEIYYLIQNLWWVKQRTYCMSRHMFITKHIKKDCWCSDNIGQCQMFNASCSLPLFSFSSFRLPLPSSNTHLKLSF